MMNHEFIDKMIKAKQMEMEAIGCLLPDPVKGHINVINRELKDMAKEVLISSCTGGTDNRVQKNEHKTSKVDIE